MDSVPTWGLFALGVVTTLAAVAIGKASTKLFAGKSIKDIVDSANAIIEMYEKHVGALELKVGTLQNEVTALTLKLDQTLKHNEKLQELLLASPAITLPKASE